jgi:uncharacterized damage-inducible protein DinB
MESIAPDVEAKRIARTLHETYSGAAWHGPSVHETLRGLTPGQAFSRPIQGAHSTWEIVLHMTRWRLFVWNKVAGERSFEITSPEQDWPRVENDSPVAWEAALQELENTQQQLLEALETFPDSRLSETVPGREYSYYKLLHGIIGHDLYHAGQITLLKKMV